MIRLFAVLAVLALVAAACGDSDDSSDTTTAATTAATTGDTAAAGGDGDGDGGDRPFEGVTLQFAKAPHGEDEVENFEEWLAPFTEATGIEVEHTVVPWDQLEAQYTANFAGGDPFDVMYQVSTHLTLFGERGAFEDITPRLAGGDFADERSHFGESIINASVFKEKLYGIPFIIGTIVMFVNQDLLAASGVDSIPTNTEELIAAGEAVRANNPDDVWGFYTPTTVVDFGWYFNLQNIHNNDGDIISDDFESATIDSDPVVQATEYAAGLICDSQIQPPLGQYNREGAIELFKAGKLAFLLDEPLRVTVFQDEGLPFEWTIVNPVGNADSGKVTQFSTTGHWVIAEESDNPDAAWELVKFLSTAEFSKTYNERYGFVPARDDVDVSGGDPLLAQNFQWAVDFWDGLKTHPKMSQILDEYVKALEAATTCDTPAAEALADAQERATDILAEE
ncbi:MAG: sugar ABC transporter substrate-binding protein [Proteobacteria bacterium]|nr:sugar ABC transporter substrate-binding protein [Pseudomonadota bacterium]